MADDATNDVQSTEIGLDDFMADEQVPAKTAPSTEETKKPEVAKEKKEEAKPEAKAEETAAPDVPVKDEAKPDEATKPDDEAKPETKPLGKAEERKAQLNTEIRDLVSQRNALKTEVEKANAEVYQPATEDELTQQGMAPIEAKVEAMRQEREMEKYNTQVAEAQLTIGHESNRVLSDFAWSNPDSESYDKDLAANAAELLQANLVLDQNTGQIIGSNVSPYQLYQTIDRARGISTAKGQMQGQKDTETMLANADTASSTGPPKKAEDPLVALWNSDD